jgi:hypothetical protein
MDQWSERFFHYLVFKMPAAREAFSSLMSGRQRVFQPLETKNDFALNDFTIPLRSIAAPSRSLFRCAQVPNFQTLENPPRPLATPPVEGI